MAKWRWKKPDERPGYREFILVDSRGQRRLLLAHRELANGDTRARAWRMDGDDVADWRESDCVADKTEWEAKRWALGHLDPLEQLVLAEDDAVEEEP